VGSPWIKDVSDRDFDAQVLARSSEVPVVVDFWAPWCGPCRALGPLLEHEVNALAGRVELCKLNTDENPETAARYGIRGIPAVKGFRGGQVVSEFTGAQPALVVRQFLEEVAPSPVRLEIEAAERLAQAGDRAQAEPRLRRLLGTPEVTGRAAITLAQLLLDAGEVGELEALLALVPPREQDEDLFATLRMRAQLLQESAAYGGEDAARAALGRNAEDLEARWALAGSLALRGEYAGALEQFLELVSRSRKFREDGARRAMIALFQRLGPDHDLTHEYRRRLQVYL
jgi:putative thioredoxin